MTDITVRVHWRPGCGFCASLLRGLERTGLHFDRVNIWEDEAAAAFVRSVTGGSETVPTVSVGSVALVNPSVRDVLHALAEHAPEQLPVDYEPPGPGLLSRAITRLQGD